MANSIVRISDGESFDFGALKNTALHPPVEVFGINRNTEFFDAEQAESVMLTSRFNPNSFNLTWQSGDYTGQDQTYIFNFFKKGGWYRLSNDVLGITDYEFTVLGINPGFSATQITCQARRGAMLKEIVTILDSQELEALESSEAVSKVFTNTSKFSANISVLIEAESEAAWATGVGTVLEAVNGVNPLGRLSFSFTSLDIWGQPEVWHGVELEVDSWREVVNGKAILSPALTKFFKVAPGQTATITLPSIDYPLLGSTLGWKLTLKATVVEDED